MLEKLKSIGESARNVLLFILLPVASIIGYIFFLRDEKKELQVKLNTIKAEKELADLLAKKEQAHNEVISAEDEYNRTRSAFLDAINTSKLKP